jgi:hypothetical protein
MFLCLFVWTFANEVRAESNYDQCIRDSTRKSCEYCFYVKYSKTSTYDKPDLSSEIEQFGEAGEPLCETNWALNRKHKGWFYVKRTDTQRRELLGYWLKASDIAGLEDFQQVVGCWPIANFVHEAGDYFFDFRAQTSNGEFDAETGEDPFETYKNGTIYAAGNVVVFSRTKKKSDLYHAGTWGYDPSTRTLTNPYGGSFSDISYHSPEQLSGCGNELKLAPVTKSK